MKNPFDLLTDEMLLEGDHQPRPDEYEWREGQMTTVKKTRNSVHNGPPMRVRVERAWWGPGTGYRMVEVTDLDTGKKYTTFGDTLVRPQPTAPAAAVAASAATAGPAPTPMPAPAPAAASVIEMPPARIIPQTPSLPGV
jgi:hypothetical protein